MGEMTLDFGANRGVGRKLEVATSSRARKSGVRGGSVVRHVDFPIGILKCRSPGSLTLADEVGEPGSWHWTILCHQA